MSEHVVMRMEDLQPEDFVALCALEEHDERTIVEIARDAVHAYVAARAEQAPPHRRAS
jgi:hypothetical protein